MLAAFMLIFVAGCTTSDSSSEYPRPFYGRLLHDGVLVDPAPQTATGRLYQPMPAEVNIQFTVHPAQATNDTPSAKIMETPSDAGILHQDEHLFLMDNESLRINKFALADGRLKQVITTVADYGLPGFNKKRMRVMEGEELWIHGLEPGKIMRLDEAGEMLGWAEAQGTQPMLLFNSGEVLKLMPLNGEKLFHLYDDRGAELRSFGILSSRKLEAMGEPMPGHGLGFLGNVSTDGNDTFVYAGGAGGGLLGYRTDGTLRYFRAYIDADLFASVQQSDSVSYMLDWDGVKNQYFALNVWDGVYYQLVYNVGGDQSFFVDAYDYDTGDYLYSIPSPEGCGYRFVTDTHLYANCMEGGFVQFERAAPGGNTELSARR